MTQREAKAFVYRWLAVVCDNVETAVITEYQLKPQAESVIGKAFEAVRDMLHGKADQLDALPGALRTPNMIAEEHKK